MFDRVKECIVLCALSCLGVVASGGVPQIQDGSFNYQGYLEFEGVPANGDFYFEVHLLDSNGDEIDPLFDQPGPIAVADGLFSMDIQMGGNAVDAEYFWDKYGHLAKKLRIMVGTVEGGPYTILSPDVDLGASPHALNARNADALRFPYTDTHTNAFGDLETMMSLTNVFGGSVLELEVENNEYPAILSVRSATPFNFNYGSQTGGVHIDAAGRRIGLFSIADEYAIAGLLTTNTGSQNTAILGQVNSGVIGATAITALNTDSGNRAYLGSPEHAGLFEGDVVVNGDVIASDNLRVQGEATRDYSINSPSPIGPLAYGSISTNGLVTAGTANLSASWDGANSRYVVSVAGESLTYQTHPVQISVVELGGPHVGTYVTSGGDIWVKIWAFDASGFVAIEDNFSIVIYSPDSVVVNRTAVPEGMDTDKYTEATGESLIQTRPRYEPVEPIEVREVGIQD